MPLQTRSILIDNTIGKIFTNVSSVSNANPSNLIAGTQIRRGGFAGVSSVVARVTSNMGAKDGFAFIATSLVTQIILSASTASKGAPIVVKIKKGTSYATATDVGTYNLVENLKTTTINVSISVAAQENLYADIVSVGTTSPGAGVGVQFVYYSG